MLSAGDPVNLGERRHLVVELADVAAHNVEIGVWFHHGVMDVVVLLEEPRRRDDGGPARQYLLTDDDRVCAYFESHRKGTVSSSLLPRVVSNPSRRRSILARA